MARFFKLLKIGALVALIIVLAVLFAPTLKGPFVVIHFSTALRGWLLAQVILLGLAVVAQQMRVKLLALAVTPVRYRFRSKFPIPPAIETLRC